MPRGLDILLGTIVGVLTAAVIRLVEDWFRRRNESIKACSDLLGRYLLQLQDAVVPPGQLVAHPRRLQHDRGIFHHDHVVCLGLVLAYKRILLVDGVYARLEELYKGLGEGLRYQFNVVDDLLNKREFHRYDRLVLAETMMDTAGGEIEALMLMLTQVAANLSVKTGLPKTI